jgi:hypothetical protein
MDGYTVQFVSFAADSYLDGPLQALPGGACQCPHWGYVVEGRMRFAFDDHEEVYEAGDALYDPPVTGPTSTLEQKLLQFSPTAKLAETERAFAEWMSASSRARPSNPSNSHEVSPTVYTERRAPSRNQNSSLPLFDTISHGFVDLRHARTKAGHDPRVGAHLLVAIGAHVARRRTIGSRSAAALAEGPEAASTNAVTTGSRPGLPR